MPRTAGVLLLGTGGSAPPHSTTYFEVPSHILCLKMFYFDFFLPNFPPVLVQDLAPKPYPYVLNIFVTTFNFRRPAKLRTNEKYIRLPSGLTHTGLTQHSHTQVTHTQASHTQDSHRTNTWLTHRTHTHRTHTGLTQDSHTGLTQGSHTQDSHTGALP